MCKALKGEEYGGAWTTAVVNEQNRYAWVADLMQRSWVRPEWFVSHEWSLADAPNAFEQTRAGEVFKGFVRMV